MQSKAFGQAKEGRKETPLSRVVQFPPSQVFSTACFSGKRKKERHEAFLLSLSFGWREKEREKLEWRFLASILRLVRVLVGEMILLGPNWMTPLTSKNDDKSWSLAIGEKREASKQARPGDKFHHDPKRIFLSGFLSLSLSVCVEASSLLSEKEKKFLVCRKKEESWNAKTGTVEFCLGEWGEEKTEKEKGFEGGLI